MLERTCLHQATPQAASSTTSSNPTTTSPTPPYAYKTQTAPSPKAATPSLISKNTTTTPNPSSITTPPRLPETPTEPQTALLRLTPSPNYTTIPALLHLTHERPTRRIHNKPVLLNILKPTNIIHLLISSFTPLLSVILTLALHSKLQHTRPTPNNVLHAIDASWRRDSDHTS
jgi:hypothetical protein